MDNHMTSKDLRVLPHGLSRSDGKRANEGIAERWLWLPPLLARMVVGAFFIQTGSRALHALNHSREILNFFWLAVPAEHIWDPFFPVMELVCAAFILFGCFTRLAAVLLFGIMTASFLDTHFRGLAGVDQFALQEFIVMVLLAVLSAAGAGTVSLDRHIFKRNSSQTS